jgi:hypothetical protein
MIKINNYILEKLHLNKDTKLRKNITFDNGVEKDALTDGVIEVLSNFEHKDKVYFRIAGNEDNAFTFKHSTCVWVYMFTYDNDQIMLTALRKSFNNFVCSKSADYYQGEAGKRYKNVDVSQVYQLNGGQYAVLIKFLFTLK